MKAYVNGDLIKREKGKRTLIIKNIGKSKAKNIKVVFLNNEPNGVIISPYPSPYELLNSNENFDIELHTYIGCNVDILKIKITWEDDFNSNNEHIQFLKIT